MRPFIVLAALVLAGFPAAGLGQEARYGCAREINAVLASAGLDQYDIDRRQDLEERTPRRGARSRVTGLHVWIWPKDCKGQLIIDLNTACQVTNTYTTGACRFEGHDHAQ